MFGYVKAYRPWLRVCELDLYKGVYCGLCKTITERSGFVPSLLLSYDLVFLTVVALGYDKSAVAAEKRRCPLHPIKKTPCVYCRQAGADNAAFEYAADAAIMLDYHKLRDDLHDKGFKKRLAAAAMLPFFAKPYKQAAARQPYISQQIEQAMAFQREIEDMNIRSVDAAAEPTARMMKAVFRGVCRYDPDDREVMGEFGYLLGRFVYICDALDDLKDDFKKRAYNPLVTKSTAMTTAGEITRESFEHAAEYARRSAYLTLGQLADRYVQLDFGDMQPITDNVVYMGLKSSLETAAKFDKREKKDTKGKRI